MTRKTSVFGLFCDLDGTLVNSLADISGNVNRVRTAHGLESLSHQKILTAIGLGVDVLITNTMPELLSLGVPRLIQEFRDFYVETPSHGGSVYPGVAETLAKVRARADFKIALVTNKQSLVAEKTVAHYLPEIRFDYVAGADRVSRHKPHPEHIQEVLIRLELKAENTWFIGDDPVDYASGTAAGVNFFAAAYGFGGVGKSVSSEIRLQEFSEILYKLPPISV